MSDKERLDEDGRLERHCSRCDEWWPADKEFFYTSGPYNGKGPPQLHSWCKACYQEVRVKRRLAKRLASV